MATRAAKEFKIYVYDENDIKLLEQLFSISKEKSKNDLYLKILRKGCEQLLYKDTQHIFSGSNKVLIETTFNNKLNRLIKYFDFQFASMFKILNMIQQILVFNTNILGEQSSDLNDFHNPKEIMFKKLDWMKRYADELEKEFSAFNIKTWEFEYEK